MRISKQAIEEFKAIYEEEHGATLDDREAYEAARNLLTLFQIIYRPIPKQSDGSKSRAGEIKQ
jgi:hypothetical protein